MCTKVFYFIFLLQIMDIKSDENCWVNGACLESVMLDQKFAENTFDCENLCKEDSGCVWFTHYLDKGLCIFLNECVQLTDISNTISGQSKCGGVSECQIIGEFFNWVLCKKDT